MIVFDNALEPWVEKSVQEHCKAEKEKGLPASAHFLIGSFVDGDAQIAHTAKCALPESAGDLGGDVISKMIDEEWIADQGEKVVRLLPGGVEVVGIAWFSSKKVFIEQKPMLTRALTRIAKITNRLTTLNMEVISNTMSLVSVETPNGKPQGVHVDVVNRQPDSPTRVSFSKLEWISLVTRMCTQVSEPVDSGKTDDFYRDFTQAIKPWVVRLNETQTILFDGEFRDDLNQPLIKDKKKRTRNAVEAQMFMDMGADENDNSVTYRPAPTMYDLTFDIEVRAAVPIKCTVATAVKAIKQHIVRNLIVRAMLHYESMELSDDGAAGPATPALHQMPRPATAVLPNQPSILVSDFLFEADTTEDSQKNLAAILQLECSSEHVDDGWERGLEAEELAAVKALPSSGPLPSLVPRKEEEGNICLYIGIVIVIVIIVIAIIVGIVVAH